MTFCSPDTKQRDRVTEKAFARVAFWEGCPAGCWLLCRYLHDAYGGSGGLATQV